MSKERYRLITEYPKDEFFDNKQVVKFDSYEVIRTLNQQADKISDLEAKLAESEDFTQGYRKECAKIQSENVQLKQQLAEKEKEIEEVRSNHANLVADIAYKAVNVYTTESKKTGIPTFYKIHYSQLLKIEDMENLRNYAQDKISFAVEQLEKVKNEITPIFCVPNGIYSNLHNEVFKTIDNQIAELKRGVE